MTSTQLAMAIGVVVVILVAVVAVVMARRRRQPRLVITPLATADVERYRADFDELQRQDVDRPQQAAARARGMVEEVLRRMGFPDRVDSAQKARDVAAYDRDLSRLLADADVAMRGAVDPESLLHVVELYRRALDMLLVEELTHG